MSEEEISEEIQDDIIDDKPKGNPEEERARAGGWRPKEEWDGPAEEWRSAEVFNERGEWITRHKEQEKRITSIEEKFNVRMDNANKLHQQQIELQRAELVRKRDDAIDLADREAANGYQDDIDSLNVQPETNNDQAKLDSWNASNQWVLGDTPKAEYAKARFGRYSAQGLGVDAAIAQLEADVAREFPEVNPARDKQPSSEGGSGPGKKRAVRKLSMADITSEERKYYHSMPGAWASEADFLQAVQDTRG